jgi:hypothetical protein
MQVDQEFTYVATPEENSFIEAYHSIVERTIERRYEFESIYDAGLVFNRWKKHYNESRLHGSLGDKSPQMIWDDYYAGVDLLGQQEAAKPEEKSRPVVNGPCETATTASYSLEFSGGEAIFAKSREKTVQNRLTNIELLNCPIYWEEVKPTLLISFFLITINSKLLNASPLIQPLIIQNSSQFNTRLLNSINSCPRSRY